MSPGDITAVMTEEQVNDLREALGNPPVVLTCPVCGERGGYFIFRPPDTPMHVDCEKSA